MKRLLIAEDETGLYLAQKHFFESHGFDVYGAFNGEEALELNEQIKFDYIICDVVMPKMDGMTFLSKTKNKKPKVVILSNISENIKPETIDYPNIVGVKLKVNTPMSEVLGLLV